MAAPSRPRTAAPPPNPRRAPRRHPRRRRRRLHFPCIGRAQQAPPPRPPSRPSSRRSRHRPARPAAARWTPPWWARRRWIAPPRRA